MKSKYYYCRHCGKKFRQFYMAEICFQLDMKLLENDKPDSTIPERQKQSGSKPTGKLTFGFIK